MNGGLRIERWIWQSPLVLGLGIAERGMVWREMDQLLLQEALPNNTDHQRENEKEDHRKRKIIYLKSQTIPSRTGKFLPFCPYIYMCRRGKRLAVLDACIQNWAASRGEMAEFKP